MKMLSFFLSSCVLAAKQIETGESHMEIGESLSLLQTAARVQSHIFGKEECKAARADRTSKRKALKDAKAAVKAAKEEFMTSKTASAEACAKKAPEATLAGKYDVYYQGSKRSVGAVFGCDGSISQPGIFTEMPHTSNVAQKCNTPRDAKATMYVMNTHGAGKYECLWEENGNVVGSHYSGPTTYWGPIEYRMITPEACAKEEKAPKAVEGEISGTIIQEDGTYSAQFAAKNVLDPTWQGGSHNNGQTWLTSGCNNGWFIMKLQETCVVKEFHLLNTCNTPYNDRSTNKFSIYLSEDNVNWELAMSGELERCAHIQGEPLVFDNPTKKKSQFVKFKMDQCYQASGGLNYFQAFR